MVSLSPVHSIAAPPSGAHVKHSGMESPDFDPSSSFGNQVLASDFRLQRREVADGGVKAWRPLR